MSASINSRNEDYDGAESSDLDEEKDDEQASDEDTADASETEEKPKNSHVGVSVQRTEIKEQMYQDKLAQIKKQIGMLKEGSLPEFLRRTKKIELQYRERLRQNEIDKTVEIERADRNYQTNCSNALKEFEEKKVDMKDSLISDLKEKRNMIEMERQTMDLNGADFMEVKPTMTRKLRRRPNDPIPIPEKRRKPSPAQVNLLLDDGHIMDDLRVMLKVSGKPVAKKQMLPSHTSMVESSSDVRIEDGRLWYDKKWYQRNSMVQVENKEGGPRIYGTITNIGNQEVKY
ncbi:hypothetical protein EGW08_005099 [Elysia chlorotica]|uniref:Sin3 histone deacetylase corepressor complex component SDS3 n=1 Tax=Elysia chlorotica TaxID=188477 RepID=A0A3S1AB15_ELYCH|nr:hypothetical protein EGW08_005099 [Elysia chlorotica]